MKTLSIKRNNDFLRLYRRGKSAADSHLICYVAPNKSGKIRLGITTSKKIGNAVRRNRARRVLRAAFREVLPEIKPGFDIILVARTKTTFTKSTALTPILTAQLRKLGALQSTKEV
ncbi:MAG: ribonuclease P protein component [Oscillospiraceae bacterium]|nr:ribonuclease P protein component [Oscillospiraceae bacterium]